MTIVISRVYRHFTVSRGRVSMRRKLNTQKKGVLARRGKDPLYVWLSGIVSLKLTTPQTHSRQTVSGHPVCGL